MNRACLVKLGMTGYRTDERRRELMSQDYQRSVARQRAGGRPLPRNVPNSRSIVVGGAAVEISGDPDSVTYDPVLAELMRFVQETRP